MKFSSTEADIAFREKSAKRLGWLRRVHRAEKWCPGLLGAIAIVFLLVAPLIWLCICGEAFFSVTRRLAAEVLVVEGWIGNDGIRAAGAEFERGRYQYIVASGGRTENWEDPSNYAEIAEQELIRFGIPKDRIIIAPSREIEHERTFTTAATVWRALHKKGIRPAAINVLTLGPHARRTRLVYAKVYEPATRVGIIAWVPSEYATQPWWQSSGRARCFLKEIVGYPFEVFLNSGRVSNSAG